MALKGVLAFRDGKRTQDFTDAFMWEVRARLTVQPELVTDGLVLYGPAVARSFGLAVDYAMLIKTPTKKGKKTPRPLLPEAAHRRRVRYGSRSVQGSPACQGRRSSPRSTRIPSR